MNTLINRIIHIISNGNARCKSTDVRTIASTGKEEGSRRITKETRDKGNRRIQTKSSECKESFGTIFNIKELCMAERKGKKDSESVKRKERTKVSQVLKTLFSFISLNILYIDLIDTYPYYAIFCIKELYIQTFNNIGVHS